MNINNPTTFGTPDLTLTTSNAIGTGNAIRTGASILTYDATVPESVSYAGSSSAGNTATAARRNHVHAGPVGVIQSIDDVVATQTINNSTTFQTTTITHTVQANEDWCWQINLLYNSNPTADLKLEWSSVPTGLTGNWSALGYKSTGAFDLQSNVSLATDITAGGQGAVYSIFLYGVFITAGTGGTLQLDFAQNTANSSDTTIEIGSWAVFSKMR